MTTSSQQYTPKGGKIRPSQIITTFGPGAVVDLPDESVMIAGIDDWPLGTVIHERRLEEALSVDHFRSPSMTRNREGDIPCVRFPKNLVCSKCGRITWSTGNRKCPDCNSAMYPARLIIICSKGHASEFPWNWWVHRDNSCCSPRLRLDNQGRTAALSDLIVRCDTCKEWKSLSGAVGSELLKKSKCKGERPWLIGAPDETCNEEPRSVLRGASNVYFSSILSALSIPPWSNPIHTTLDDHWETLKPLPAEAQKAVIQSHPAFKGFQITDILQAISDRLTGTTTTDDLRKDEFLAFCNPGSGIGNGDFQIQDESVPSNIAKHISRVVLAFRLREVRVLRGFARVDPPDANNSNLILSPIMYQPQSWLPAVEHRGEGIFLELPQDKVSAWEARPRVQERVKHLETAYNTWRQQRGMPATTVLPRQVLVHTLAHLFIRQLSLDCGYSSSSLRERIYAGPDMCGLLIYTASSDSDGSLGGLIHQGSTNRFDATMQALLESAQWCSSDPLCSEHDPMQTGKLNGACCHACGLVSETSCEFANRLLDRALICDLVGVSGTGYFSAAS